MTFPERYAEPARRAVDELVTDRNGTSGESDARL